MVSFKLAIGEPSTGRAFQKEVKDETARCLIGLNVGDKISGDKIGFQEYEFLITGGSDYCGFPMRKGILGVRKKITILGGVGFRGGEKGVKRRKTVCGHKIHENISQINLKIIKAGTKGMAELLGLSEDQIKPGKKSDKKGKESVQQ